MALRLIKVEEVPDSRVAHFRAIIEETTGFWRWKSVRDWHLFSQAGVTWYHYPTGHRAPFHIEDFAETCLRRWQLRQEEQSR